MITSALQDNTKQSLFNFSFDPLVSALSRACLSLMSEADTKVVLKKKKLGPAGNRKWTPKVFNRWLGFKKRF